MSIYYLLYVYFKIEYLVPHFSICINVLSNRQVSESIDTTSD